MYKRLLIAVLVISTGFLLNSCRKDVLPDAGQSQPANLAVFKQWFAARSVKESISIPGFTNYNSSSAEMIKLQPLAGSQPAGNTVNRLKMKPDWAKALTYQKGDSLVAEVAVDSKSSIAFSLESFAERFDFRKAKSITRFLFIQTPRKTRGTYMTIIGTDAYLKGNAKKLQQNTLGKKDKNFSGYVLYHSLSGFFLNGYLYHNGKVIGALQPRIVTPQQGQAARSTSERLLNATPTCETYYITQYYEQCTDWYNGGGNYMYTSCNYWSETSYFDICTGGDGGNGGGGSGDPPPGDGGPADPCDDGGNGGIGVINSNGERVMSIIPGCEEEEPVSPYNCNCSNSCPEDASLVDANIAYEPKWGQLGHPVSIVTELYRATSVSGFDNLTMVNKLSSIKDYFGKNRFFTRSTNGTITDDATRAGYGKIDRYIYSEKFGWIDMHHFFYSAYLDKKYGENYSFSATHVGEYIQYLKDNESAYSYEDLPSNFQGIMFWRKYGSQIDNGQVTLHWALSNYFAGNSFTTPDKAPNFDYIPHIVDGNYPKNYSGKGFTGEQLLQMAKDAFCKKSADIQDKIIDAHIQIAPGSN